MLCVVTDPSTANAGLSIGATAQGTCTNPDWSSSECGSFCLSESGSLFSTCGHIQKQNMC